MNSLKKIIEESPHLNDKAVIRKYIQDNNLEFEYAHMISDLSESRTRKLRNNLFGDAYIAKQELIRRAVKARDEYDEDWCGYEIANEIIELIEEAEEF